MRMDAGGGVSMPRGNLVRPVRQGEDNPVRLCDIKPSNFGRPYYLNVLGITLPHDKIILELADKFRTLDRNLAWRDSGIAPAPHLRQSHVTEIGDGIKRFVAIAKDSNHGRLDRIHTIPTWNSVGGR